MIKILRGPGRYFLSLLAAAGWMGLHGQSDGGFTSGAAAYCDSVNSGFISLNSYNGLILYWEQSTDQFSWQQIQNTTSTQSYNNLKQTTSYRAIVQDGAFPPDTSTVATITVHVPGVAGVVNGGGTFCAAANNGSLTLTGTQGNVLFWQYQDAGGPWQPISTTSFTTSFTNLLASRAYRAIVQRVQGCDADTSAPAFVVIDETTLGGVIGGSDTLCFGTPGDTLSLAGHRGGVLHWLVSADNGQSWTNAQNGGLTYAYPKVSGTNWYAAVVKNGVCPEDTSARAVVAAFPEVVAVAGPDKFITRRESVQLHGEGNGSALWRPSTGLSDSTSFSPVASPAETMVYILLVTDTNGCYGMDSVRVVVEIPIPSAITPNGDGVNDRFEIYEVEKFAFNALRIYNRWGQLVFEAAPYSNEWDGRSMDGSALPEGTYFYTFDFGQGKSPVTGYILVKR